MRRESGTDQLEASTTLVFNLPFQMKFGSTLLPSKTEAKGFSHKYCNSSYHLSRSTVYFFRWRKMDER